jgi:hypothetical protein
MISAPIASASMNAAAATTALRVTTSGRQHAEYGVLRERGKGQVGGGVDQ